MRLIDADKLMENMKGTNRYFDVKLDIEEAPTVDTVPVVRCKDCENFMLDDRGNVCEIREGLVDPEPEDFCSYGKRKDGETE